MSIKVQGLEKAIKKLSKYPEEVRLDTAKAMNASMINVQTEAKFNLSNNGNSDTGNLRSKIITTKAKKSDLVATTTVNADYAPYVEFGTKSQVKIPQGLEQYALQFKGKKGTYKDLLDNIKIWAARKGIPEEEVEGIAQKIAWAGVKARPFLFPAWEKERPKFEKAVKELLQR